MKQYTGLKLARLDIYERREEGRGGNKEMKRGGRGRWIKVERGRGKGTGGEKLKARNETSDGR